jgi:hypothetical protein
MNDESVLQALHIDDIRKSKKMTVEELCDNIIDSRQFRRYKTGEYTMPFNNLVLFCEKLDISLNDFFYSMLQKDRRDYNKLAEIYDLCNEGNYRDAKAKLDLIKSINRFDSQNRKFYEFIRLSINYYLNYSSKKDILFELRERSSYSQLKKRTAFDFNDVLYLNLISIIENELDFKDSFDLLNRILCSSEQVYLSSENKHIFPMIYSNLASFYGDSKMIDKALKTSQEGINYCLTYKLFDCLPNLYYIEMLCHQFFGNDQKCFTSAVACISTCITSRDNQSLELYSNLIEKDLGVDPFSLFNRTHLT